MLFFPCPSEKCPSPLKDSPEEFVKELMNKYQGIGFHIISQLFPSLWDDREYSRYYPMLGNRTMVGPSQPSIKALTGGGILKDTPRSSPNRENSLLHMIDASTLHQVRLYTSVGAKVRVENLVFTPYSDPFAPLVLKQEETHDDVIEEIDNYPSNALASAPI
ncbi:hypothetical protein LIER_35505 [Lithospermum erythrorhizon]|uniref:Uncharacterized protein n=1 Tax=Lithospermum erythrorhizon TaxID=34254 RepID=A0AAV3NT72_LITER